MPGAWRGTWDAGWHGKLLWPQPTVQKSRCPQTTVVPVNCEVGLPPGLRLGAGRAHGGCAAARPSAAPAPAQGAGTLPSPGRLRGLPPALPCSTHARARVTSGHSEEVDSGFQATARRGHMLVLTPRCHEAQDGVGPGSAAWASPWILAAPRVLCVPSLRPFRSLRSKRRGRPPPRR